MGKEGATAGKAGAGFPRFTHGAYQDVGDRPYQEDGFIVCRDVQKFYKMPDSLTDRPAGVYAVLDGHGGDECVSFAQEHLVKNLVAGLARTIGGRSGSGGDDGREDAATATATAVASSSSSSAAAAAAASAAAAAAAGAAAAKGDSEEEQIKAGMAQGMAHTEKHWLALQLNSRRWDKSGCCVCLAFCLGDRIFVMNVGDCRAVLLNGDGKPWTTVTRDHKPGDAIEKARIEAVGARVDQHVVPVPSCCCWNPSTTLQPTGPERVQPGGLAVARSLGTAGVKLEAFGAIPGAVVATPDIFVLELRQTKSRVLLLGCDGVWDYVKDSKPARLSTFNTYYFRLQASYQRKGHPANKQLRMLAEDLVDKVLTWDTSAQHDNTSILLLRWDDGDDGERVPAAQAAPAPAPAAPSSSDASAAVVTSAPHPAKETTVHL